MGKTIGYMVTWTTYGTWLQGDERGWVKAGVVREGNSGIYNANKAAAVSKPVRLVKKEKEVSQKAICEKAAAMGDKIFAISVGSNHIHIVLGYNGRPIESTVRIYKNTATAALQRIGLKGKIWTNGFDKRFCFSEKDLRTRVEYVNRH